MNRSSLQENIISIIHSREYRGYNLNPTKKGFKGFYQEILDDLLRLFSEAKSTFTIPRVAHFIIENPKDNIFDLLQIYIKRWLKARDKARERESTNFKYLAAIEIKPTLKETHVHLCIIFDDLTTGELYKLEDYLYKLTKDAKEDNAKLFYRKRRPDEINTSKHWHCINTNEFDAFTRISYLAKVFSKITTNEKPNYICSKPI